MAKQKQKWTTEEEHALCAGVEKHGQGKWKVILSDPEFSPSLANRSNIDLKDKWRNLGVSGGMSSGRERGRTPRLLEGVAINSIVSSPEPLSAVPLLEYDGTAEPSSRSSLDKRTVPEYDAMIFEALFNFDDPNGPDDNKIMDFIEQMYEVPESFRRSVTSMLRRLVLIGELEKVDNCYKFKNAMFGAEPSQRKDIEKAPESSPTPGATENDAPEDFPTPLAIENAPEGSAAPPPVAMENDAPEGPAAPPVAMENDAPEGSAVLPPVPTETLEDASLYAVYTVAVAESTEQEVAAACEKAEMLAAALEESTARLMLIEELHERFK